MATIQIDISAKLKAFPYVAPAITNAAREVQEQQEEASDFISDLEEFSSNIPTDITQLIGPLAQPGAGIAGNDEWERMAVPIDDSLGWVGSITGTFESAFLKLDSITAFLVKILRVIELFNSSLKSFSSLFVSVIDFAQSQLDEYAGSLQAGVHGAVFAPPALFRKSAGNSDTKHQLRGGFDGFIDRLDNSLQNTKDDERPTYNTGDYVGGMVLLVDTESLDEMWAGLGQFVSMFDFMQLLPINLSPPPPTNLRGFCGYFIDQDELEKPRAKRNYDNKKFGVRIEWDNSFTASAYKIYRSRYSGGSEVLVNYFPTTLTDNQETGDPGLLTVASDILAAIVHKGKGDFEQPKKWDFLYNDPDFNGGEPVKFVAPLSVKSTLSYIDTDIKTKPIEGTDIEYAYIEENGQEVSITNYYYVIRGCGLVGWPKGPNSQELNVAIKTCNDNFNLAKVIQHPQGRFEYLDIGGGILANWQSIQLGRMVPWYQEIIGILSGFLDTLRGTVNDASDAFSGFLDHMASRISMYRNILSLTTWLIGEFKKFVFGPSLALLNLPPVKGGMPVFVERVKQAKVPEGAAGFSGPEGITIGIVLVYGGSPAVVGPLKAAFTLIESLLTEN